MKKSPIILEEQSLKEELDLLTQKIENFKKQIKNTLEDGNILLLTNEKYRGTGVSTEIWKFAQKNNLPILVNSTNLAKIHKERFPSVECYSLKEVEQLIYNQRIKHILLDVNLRNRMDIIENIRKKGINCSGIVYI